MENIYSGKSSNFSRSVFIIALVAGILINLLLLGLYQYYITNYTHDIKIKEPKITYVPQKPTPLPEPVKKKKQEKEKKLEKKKKTLKEEKPLDIKKESKKVVSKPKKATGEKVEKEPVIPAVTPPIPEKVELDEEKISLPENELPEGNFIDVPAEKVVIKEFKAVSPGVFNPSFGTELSKLDTSVRGTAKDRKVVYRPAPPTVKAKVPPPAVKVKLWINPDGTVSKVQLLETTGNPKIDKKIREYILSWKFNKISSNEKQWAVTTIKFKSSK